MTKDELMEIHKEIPHMIDSSIEMTEANSSIKVFEGEFIIRNDKHEIKLNGCLYFEWVPDTGACFFGETEFETIKLAKISGEIELFKIIINGLEFGEGYITNTKFIDLSNVSFLKGTLQGLAVLGDKSIPVEKLRFSIPNLRGFHGIPVKKLTATNLSISKGRIRLENDNYVILIDKSPNYKKLKESLEEKGGYIILYGGELTSKKGAIKFEDSKDIIHCLDTFLNFLNGRRTAALFIQGIYEDQIKWCDYSDYTVDTFKFVPSWPQKHSIKGINELWQAFSKIWKDNDDKNFLTILVHWYVEANSHSGFSEGSIVMAQTALELLYNWWVIENKKIIVGKDSENISAANKIRLLLSQLNISYSVPTSFTHLQTFMDSSKEIIDAPDAVVQIRNAIVHSQEEKRKKLSTIHPQAKYEALQLCIWYIEMSLLCILEFDDQYFSRCSRGQELWTEKSVPWTKNKSK